MGKGKNNLYCFKILRRVTIESAISLMTRNRADQAIERKISTIMRGVQATISIDLQFRYPSEKIE